MGAGARHRDEQQAFLFLPVRALRLFLDAQPLRSGDQAERRRAALAAIGGGEACLRQAGQVDRLELQALAGVHGHQAHGVHVQRGGGHLPQIALLRQQDQLADPIERPMDRERPTPTGLCSRRKFRNCQTATLRMRVGHRIGGRHRAARSVRSRR